MSPKKHDQSRYGRSPSSPRRDRPLLSRSPPLSRSPERLATPARTGIPSMQVYVARLNIERFRQLIASETDRKKLDLLRRLLADEEAKLVRLLAPGATPS